MCIRDGCCHPGADGKFTDETYDSLVKLTAWLCKQLDLSPKDVIRHYDVTGKACPKSVSYTHLDVYKRQLQMDENFVMTDDSDPDTPPQVYTAEELFAIRDRLIGEFKPYKESSSTILSSSQMCIRDRYS